MSGTASPSASTSATPTPSPTASRLAFAKPEHEPVKERVWLDLADGVAFGDQRGDSELYSVGQRQPDAYGVGVGDGFCVAVAKREHELVKHHLCLAHADGVTFLNGQCGAVHFADAKRERECVSVTCTDGRRLAVAHCERKPLRQRHRFAIGKPDAVSDRVAVGVGLALGVSDGLGVTLTPKTGRRTARA